MSCSSFFVAEVKTRSHDQKRVGVVCQIMMFSAPWGGQIGYHWSGFWGKTRWGEMGKSIPKNYSPWGFLDAGWPGGCSEVTVLGGLVKWDEYRNSCVLWAEVFYGHNCGSPTLMFYGWVSLMCIFGLAITYVGLQVTPCNSCFSWQMFRANNYPNRSYKVFCNPCRCEPGNVVCHQDVVMPGRRMLQRWTAGEAPQHVPSCHWMPSIWRPDKSIRMCGNQLGTHKVCHGCY